MSKVKVVLEGGPLDGEQYSFNGFPDNDRLYFVYKSQRLAYELKREPFSAMTAVTFEYVGRDELTWKNLKSMN